MSQTNPGFRIFLTLSLLALIAAGLFFAFRTDPASPGPDDLAKRSVDGGEETSEQTEEISRIPTFVHNEGSSDGTSSNNQDLLSEEIPGELTEEELDGYLSEPFDPTPEGPEFGAISGVVVDEENRPMADVKVSLAEKISAGSGMMFGMEHISGGYGGVGLRTDEEGRFSFRTVDPEKSWTVHARRFGYDNASSKPITVSPGESRTGLRLKLNLLPRIEGHVRDASGNVVVGVGVKAQTQMRGGMFRMVMLNDQSVTTDENGFYSLPHEPGAVSVWAEGNGYIKSSEKAVQVPDTGAVTADLTVKLGGIISGRVITPDAQPAKNVRVFAQKDVRGHGGMMMGREGGESTRTADDGSFTIVGLTDGKWTIIADPRSDGDMSFSYSTAAVGGGVVMGERIIQKDDSDDETSNEYEWLSTGKVEGVETGRTDVEIELQAAASVSGVVVGADGNPILNAVVDIVPISRDAFQMHQGPGGGTTTDELGQFRLTNVDLGEYKVTANAEGYTSGESATFQLYEAQAKEGIRIELRQGRSVSGRVLSRSTGQPLADVAIQFSEASGGRNFSISIGGAGLATNMTDEKGQFTITGLEDSAYTFTFDHPEHAPNRTEVDLSNGLDRGGLTIELEEGATVEGIALEENGQPIADKMVTNATQTLFFGGKDWLARYTRTAEDGTYTLSGLPSGTSSISLVEGPMPFPAMASEEVNLQPGQVQQVNFRLGQSSGIRMTGTVRRGGQPLPNAELTIVEDGGHMGSNMRQITSDASGQYSVSGLKPGRHTVYWTDAEVEVTIPDQPLVTLDIVIPNTELSGIATESSSGSAVSGASVSIQKTDAEGNVTRYGHSLTDENGRFTISGIPAGVYDVHLKSGEHEAAVQAGVTVIEGSPTASLSFSLVAASFGKVTGVVTSAPTGQPLGNVTVRLSDPAASGGYYGGVTTTISASDGTFKMNDAKAGTWNLVASHSDYAPILIESVTISPSTEHVQNLVLDPGGTVKTTIIDATSGQPIQGASVQLFYPSGTAVPVDWHRAVDSRQTDEQGINEYPHAPAGTITVAGSKEGYTLGSAKVIVNSGQVATVTIELKPE